MNIAVATTLRVKSSNGRWKTPAISGIAAIRAQVSSVGNVKNIGPLCLRHARHPAKRERAAPPQRRTLHANTTDPAPPVRRCCPLEGEAAARPQRGWSIQRTGLEAPVVVEQERFA